jgi:hypothetical protein
MVGDIGERLLPQPDDFTDEERDFDKFLRSILTEEEILALRDIFWGIKPPEAPALLPEESKRRIMENVFASLGVTPPAKSTLGTLVAKYRRWRGMRPSEQAEELGVGVEIVHKLERDTTPIAQVAVAHVALVEIVHKLERDTTPIDFPIDNRVISQLAQKYKVSFWKLLRLIIDAFTFSGLQKIQEEDLAPTFSYTRAAEQLEEEEYKALIDKILRFERGVGNGEKC